MRQTSEIQKIKLLILFSLKGFSQVMLMENRISGTLILLGVSLYSPYLGLMALLSSIVGTGIGLLKDPETAKKGIYGFNSILSGVAVMLFLNGNWRWLIALIVATFSAILMYILMKILTRWRIPVLTIPFVATTWIGLLVTYQLKFLHINSAFITSSPVKWNIPSEGKPNFIRGLIKGVGEVFIIDSFWAGFFILIALFVAGWRFGVYAVLGTFISWLTALFIGVDTESLDLGLYNYNAVLTVIAVGLLFDDKRNYLLFGMFAAAITVPITAGMDSLLNPMGLPALTSPFIVSTWIFLIIRKITP
jgi:urea transporter